MKDTKAAEDYLEEKTGMILNHRIVTSTGKVFSISQLLTDFAASEIERLMLSEEEIEQVACDEMQQDWNRLEYGEVYKDGFIDGANFKINHIKSKLKDK